MEKSSARWWDLASAIYLFLAILFSAWRLQSTGWTDGLEHVRNVALLGLIIGLALGQSYYQRRGVVLLSIGYMLVIFCWQWLAFLNYSSEDLYLGDKLLLLAGRLWVSLAEFFSGRPVEDPFFLVAVLCIPYGLAGLFSGYQTTRHANALASVLPNGILIFLIYLNHYTLLDYNWFFGAYLFFALLLLSRQKYLVDRIKWVKERVQVSSESNLDLNNITMLSAAVLIILAWTIPFSLPFNPQAKENWQKASKEWFSNDNRIEDIFSSIKKERIPSSSNDFIQTELPLGTQTTQSAFVAFLVYAPAAAQEIPRLYWRGYVYDFFEDGRWQSTGLESLAFKPQDGNFEIPKWERRTNLNFTFDVYANRQNILYTPSQPVWVNRTAKIIHSKISTEDEAMDVMILRASPPLKGGDIYHANALLANPTIPELQEAGQEYPKWVMGKYLQLPPDFSLRIQALALEITAPFDTPYTKTVAITNYLRTEIKYAPVMKFPEESVDPLEYFLFESKQGFCNYYASAEVLMLRSVGVPARLAVGFAQGESNLQNTFYTVRERDAHAWPEVYFPGYGWIEFEPTGNQAPLERPQERDETGVAASDQSNNPLEFDALEQEEPQLPLPLEMPKENISSIQIFQISIIASGFMIAFLAIFLKRRYAPNIQTAVILKTLVEHNGWEAPSWL
ncbi:MAG: transglutaminase domain-containing protein, partial [Anaerolineales bacterium]|nr:transglutaminase domain-containing protein [Anaerolineales bacterium]